MADSTENTAFLADNDHDQESSIGNGGAPENTTKTPPNTQFKHPIKILTILISVFSGFAFVSVITAFVVLQVGTFQYAYGIRPVIQELGVTTFISLILAILMVVLQLPALVALIIDIVLPILVLIYSGNVFGNGWPERHICQDRGFYDPNRPKIDNSQCLTELLVLRISMGVAAGFGFIVGLLYLTVLLLRIIVVSRTKFWKKASMFTPGAYTFSITMNVMRKDANGNAHTGPVAAEEGQLIDA